MMRKALDIIVQKVFTSENSIEISDDSEPFSEFI